MNDIEDVSPVQSFDQYILHLIEVKENWLITSVDGESHVIAFGKVYPLRHPFYVYCKLYREEKNPELKYKYMKAMHDYLWPGEVAKWHYWTERRFRAHCGDYECISLASGTSTAKSYDSAKIAILFWLSNPKGHGVLVASTTLDSLEGRVFGYIQKLLNKAALPIEYLLMASKPPKILNEHLTKKDKDPHHGIFAVAAKKGDDDSSINTWIGRHPDDGLMLLLDEGPDMPFALVGAFPNVKGNQKWYQCIIIGNSNSKTDLHGALSTPAVGWDKLDFRVGGGGAYEWPTTQEKGICLYFHPEDSPAIHETDVEKKKLLEGFLITSAKLKKRKEELGEDSINYWRMILGFWKPSSIEDVIVSESYAATFDTGGVAEWSGRYPLKMFAGLDAAFSTGGDKCILRLGILGVTVSGLWVLDYRKDKLLFTIGISAASGESAEMQIAKQVIDILASYNVPLNHLAVDSNGQGRALSSVIRLVGRSLLEPLKIYSTKSAIKVARSFDIIVKSGLDLWWEFRPFMQNHQIRGLDDITLMQLTSRQVVTDTDTGKQKLESKLAFKRRMSAESPSLAHSPDEADAASLCLQAAIIQGGFTAGHVQAQVSIPTNFRDEKAFAHVQEMERIKREASSRNTGIPKASFKGGLESFARHHKSFSS